MIDELAQLEARIGYSFRDRDLLKTAVTHLSFLAEHPESGESNQRLEFLGDAVLQILLAEELFHRFFADREGVLSKRRSLLVNGTFLAQLAREIGLNACLRLGTSEESTGGRTRPGALADAFEALVGAIYLDSDFATTRWVIMKIYGGRGAARRHRRNRQPEGPAARARATRPWQQCVALRSDSHFRRRSRARVSGRGLRAGSTGGRRTRQLQKDRRRSRGPRGVARAALDRYR
jgi:dsRNA-specific ribonuclease